VRELASLGTVEELVAALVRWNPGLCAGLRRRLPEYRESNDLALLEEELDRGYFVAGMARWSASTDPNAVILRDQLAAEIDRANLRLVFQCIAGDIDAEAVSARLLPHGTLSGSLLRQMAEASDPSGAVERLAGTSYSGLVEELFQLLQTGRFAPVERYLDRLHLNQMRRFARRDVFGIGVLMDYVWRKYNECVNLRLVARGLAGGLPVGRVRDELHFA
jgi:vacuolar-type H+-ATPase subunit C/Vma6